MKTLGQLSEEYNDLRGKVLNLCYQLPYPQTFKNPINIEMVDRYTEEIIGIDEDGYLTTINENAFSFEDDVVGAGELLYLLETIEEQENDNN
jgi:hypothetical protein